MGGAEAPRNRSRKADQNGSPRFSTAMGTVAPTSHPVPEPGPLLKSIPETPSLSPGYLSLGQDPEKGPLARAWEEEKERAFYRQALAALRYSTMRWILPCRKILSPTRYSTANPKPWTLNPRTHLTTFTHRLSTVESIRSFVLQYGFRVYGLGGLGFRG